MEEAPLEAAARTAAAGGDCFFTLGFLRTLGGSSRGALDPRREFFQSVGLDAYESTEGAGDGPLTLLPGAGEGPRTPWLLGNVLALRAGAGADLRRTVCPRLCSLRTSLSWTMSPCMWQSLDTA